MKNVLLCTCRETNVGSITISGHLRHGALDEEKDHELVYFSNLICSQFRSTAEMFLECMLCWPRKYYYAFPVSAPGGSF